LQSKHYGHMVLTLQLIAVQFNHHHLNQY